MIIDEIYAHRERSSILVRNITVDRTVEILGQNPKMEDLQVPLESSDVWHSSASGSAWQIIQAGAEEEFWSAEINSVNISVITSRIPEKLVSFSL
jgi:hypothetical protein